jgi:hypothetical protein
MITVRQLRLAMLALAAGLATHLWSDTRPFSLNGFVSQADARVGRPATPMSYAGVARRTTRRTVADGAAAGAAAAGAYYYAAPGCQQVVNSYGQIVYTCP